VTRAPANLRWVADRWEEIFPRAVFSGIVADSLHVSPTKHKSYGDNPAGSWPRQHAKDRQGPRDTACAIDISMPQADLVLVHNRFRNVFNDRATDPRARYVAAFNGWDGTGGPGRYNLVTGEVTGTDDSHKSHEHVESFYLYVGDDPESWRCARAIISTVRGDSAAEFNESEEGDVPLTPSEFLGVLRDPAVATELAALAVRYSGSPLPPGPDGRNQSVAWLLSRVYTTVAAVDLTLKRVAEETGIDAAELQAIRDAAREGSEASAQAIITAVLAGLDRTNLTLDGVEQALRNVLLHGAAASSSTE